MVTVKRLALLSLLVTTLVGACGVDKKTPGVAGGGSTGSSAGEGGDSNPAEIAGSGGTGNAGGSVDAGGGAGHDGGGDGGSSGSGGDTGVVDPCDSNPCDENATCDSTADPICTCKGPYWESDGQGGCRDVLECAADNGGCMQGLPCAENVGAPPGCGCESGYSGSAPNCLDIDECAVNTDDCDANQWCNNTPGSFNCVACDAISKCASGLTCKTSSDETCGACAAGYIGDGTSKCTACDTGTYDSDNACVSCGDIANCAAQETCNATNGTSEICPTCAAGYTGNGTGACTNINECTTNADNCDATPDACVDTVGSFMCACPVGYTGNGVGNGGCASECLTGNGGCDPLTTCSNVAGGVVCGGCPAGYTGTGATACTPRLTGLTLSAGTLTPALSANVTLHSSEVSLISQTLSLTPTAPAGTAITIAGTAVASGAQWTSGTLNLGENAITIVVSQPGHPSGTYTLTVKRGKQEAYVKASNTDSSDRFGHDVAVSGDGNTLVVSGVNEDSAGVGVNGPGQADNTASTSGAAYVFVRSGSTWTQQAYLKPDNTSADDYFGWSVSISNDGNTLAVGSYGEDTSATDSGAVYVFTRSAGVWTQRAMLKASNPGATDTFGTSIVVSPDGNTLAVAAIGEDSNAALIAGDQSNNSLTNAGAVYVFARAGNSWTQQAYVKASNPGSGDNFGEDGIALSSDGNTLAVGAFAEDCSASGTYGASHPNDDGIGNSGAVYVYVRSGSTWSHQAYLKAPTPSANQYFGWEVALSSNGNTLAVGAYGENAATGATYVLTRSGSTWSHQASLVASNADIGDQFGWDVSLSADGNALLIGAYDEDSSATGIGGSQGSNAADIAGAAYLFTRSGGSWSQQAYLKASNTAANDRFGVTVAISGDGGTLAVGAYLEDSGGTGVNSDTQSDESAKDAGAVYVFR